MFRLEGRLHSNGEGLSQGGGGAGGSVIVRSVHFDGEGSVEASGGKGVNNAGGGGGGRIAVYYTGESTFIGSYQAYGGSSSVEKGGAGTVYVENRKNISAPHRILRINNGVARNGVLGVAEFKELVLTGNSLPYPYNAIQYKSPSGVKISTTGSPYCSTVNSNLYCSDSNLARLLQDVSSYYYTQHASPVITYEFPIPLVLEYMLIYPTCGINNLNTQHYIRVYRNNDVIAQSRDWVDTTNCVKGQPRRMEIKQFVTKVKTIDDDGGGGDGDGNNASVSDDDDDDGDNGNVSAN